jgi:membrane fusion protein (multidrug efflux system)
MTGQLSRASRRAALLLPLTSAILLNAGCPKGSGQQQRGKAERQPLPVKVEPVRRGDIRMTLRYPGELKAPESVEVASEVGGRIQTIAVRMGERVKQGQLLVSVDDSQLRTQHQEARAALLVARSALRRAEVDDRNAATELGRKAPLAKRDLITQQEMDNVRTRRDSAAASLAVAKAQVSQADARVTLLQKQLKDTRIRAAFAGWIQARHLDAGAVVTAGTAVLRLVRTTPIVVRFQVGERHIGELRRRMAAGSVAVHVGVDAYPRDTFTGNIVRVAPALDAASRTAAVEAELPNDDGRLMPGMFCRVTLDLGTHERALLVPLTALVGDEQGGTSARQTRAARVYVTERGKARLVTLQLGAADDKHAEVLGGLEQGQQVVVEGQDSLEDGTPVEVVGGAAPAPASAPAAPKPTGGGPA